MHVPAWCSGPIAQVRKVPPSFTSMEPSLSSTPDGGARKGSRDVPGASSAAARGLEIPERVEHVDVVLGVSPARVEPVAAREQAGAQDGVGLLGEGVKIHAHARQL